MFGVWALHASARIVDACVVFAADTAVFADAGSRGAAVFFASAVDTLFARLTGFLCTWIGYTLTILTLGAACTFDATTWFGASAVGDATELCGRAGVVGLTWVPSALGI